MKHFIAAILFLSFLSIHPILADTITVSGDVYGTWSVDTVLVVGEVRVPTDSTLTIEPGVDVIFQGHYKLIVDSLATLLAVGTEQDSILFTAADTSEGWHGIRYFMASDSCTLVYSHITHGHASGGGSNNDGGGIHCIATNLIVSQCLIDNCSAERDAGGLYFWGAAPLLINSTIKLNSAEVSGGGVYSSTSDVRLINNTIDRNVSGASGGGIHCYHFTPLLIGNTVTNNHSVGRGGGIYCHCSNASPTGVIIEYNTIDGNVSESEGGGLVIQSCWNVSARYNTIANNHSYQDGGGVFCLNSETSIVIENNVIDLNSADLDGGGIYCSDSSPLISYNIISSNYSINYGGGILITDYSSSTIIGNVICNNIASGTGGGIYSSSSGDSVIGNVIYGNITNVESGGGGIYINGFDNSIRGNFIRNNHCGRGAGIYVDGATDSDVSGNVIFYNESFWDGGGMYFNDFADTITNNTVLNNSGEFSMSGGIYLNNSNLTLLNFIIRGNLSSQITLSGSPDAQITYSNIQGGWTGTGNIDDAPLFVNPFLNEFRLQWGSPCIDAGDPDPQYNDPDSTRADMGAFLFDQSMPVRILISPHEIPYLIAPEGGTMDYTIQATNIYQSTHNVTVWCDVGLPDGTVYGPVLGPVTVTIEPDQTVERIRTQTVPAPAPMGVYHYNAYAVVDSDTSKDSFMFGKLGTTSGGIDGWGNAGDPLIEVGGGQARGLPGTHAIVTIYPNPFNAVTTIRFELPEASYVTLEVFDIGGRHIGMSGSGTTPTTALVNGWRDKGVHEVVFDGSELASGVYLYRLEMSGSGPEGGLSSATPTMVMGKMVLMK